MTRRTVDPLHSETYSETARGVIIGPERIAAEVRAHGASYADWLADTYPDGCPVIIRADAADVLAWLGY